MASLGLAKTGTVPTGVLASLRLLASWLGPDLGSLGLAPNGETLRSSFGGDE